MKIAIATAGLPPLYNGGAEIAAVETAKYAVKAGHDVHIIALDGTDRGESGYESLQTTYGFRIHRIRAIPVSCIYALSALPAIVTTALAIRPHIIHSQGMMMAPAAMVAAKVCGARLLVYGRGEIYVEWPMDRVLRTKQVIHKMILRMSDRIIAQTENMKQEMLKYHSREIEVIPNGIDVGKYGRMAKREARDRLHLPQDVKIAISVGRCRPEKNLRQFVESAIRKDVVYLLIGDGPQMAGLKTLAERINSRVVFAGAMDNEVVAAYLCASDIMVNTSTSEGFPMSILEGMASGLTIVATRVCGMPEIVEDGINGILTEPGNAEETARAIDCLTNDTVKCEEIGKRNKEKARGYSWESIVKKLYG